MYETTDLFFFFFPTTAFQKLCPSCKYFCVFCLFQTALKVFHERCRLPFAARPNKTSLVIHQTRHWLCSALPSWKTSEVGSPINNRFSDYDSRWRNKLRRQGFSKRAFRISLRFTNAETNRRCHLRVCSKRVIQSDSKRITEIDYGRPLKVQHSCSEICWRNFWV